MAALSSRRRSIKCFLSWPSVCLVSAARAFSSQLPSHSVPYEPPSWCKGFLCNVPQQRLILANLPTPLYRLQTRLKEPNNYNRNDNKVDNDSSSLLQKLHNLGIAALYIKRDDCTGGVELGGNKIRKLEFLLSDALVQDYNAVVTIGGEQSNHCRATAAACRMVGLEPHLILRTQQRRAAVAATEDGEPNTTTVAMDLGTVGNLLVDRMVGSSIYTCTPGEYGRVGSDELVARLCAHLQQQQQHAQKEGNCRPYPIPVGGSNGIGSWGYINAVEELLLQWRQLQDHDAKPSSSPSSPSSSSPDHIVFACGSGGTAAGIVLGMALAHEALLSDDDSDSSLDHHHHHMPKIHAIGVCDDPDYFYAFVAGISDQMGLVLPPGMSTEEFIRQHMIVYQGKGLGYAQSTPEELEFVFAFARETGIVLDPVYSGKALYNFVREIEKDPESFRDQTILFWHTGGALGLYDKSSDLEPAFRSLYPCQRLDVYGKGIGIDVSSPSSDDGGRPED